MERDKYENLGEIILESLLSSSIESISNLSFANNTSWFCHSDKSGNIDLLSELITKQADLQLIDLGMNFFSSQNT